MGMGGIDVRMNYDQMGEMASEYNKAASDLSTTSEDMKKISQMLEAGALVGDAGTAFKDAIDGVLQSKIKLIIRKMNELNKDVNGAVAAMKGDVSIAKGRFA